MAKKHPEDDNDDDDKFITIILILVEHRIFSSDLFSKKMVIRPKKNPNDDFGFKIFFRSGKKKPSRLFRFFLFHFFIILDSTEPKRKFHIFLVIIEHFRKENFHFVFLSSLKKFIFNLFFHLLSCHNIIILIS